MKKVMPVVLELGFRELLAAGASMEIHCVAAPVPKSSPLAGQWKFAARMGQGDDAVLHILVKQRNVQDRVILTAGACVSLAMSLGAVSVTVPVVEGGIGVCEMGPLTSCDERQS